MTSARYDRNKTPASLKHNSGLLRVDVHGPNTANGANQDIEDLADLLILIEEMFVNAVPPTGVRHVAGDKSLSALRALPKWLVALVGYSTAHLDFAMSFQRVLR